MDWQVIITSVLTSLVSSSIVTAGIIYVLKKSFDSALDYRFEKLLEQQRANIHEEARREASLYDKQFEALKQAVAITYRLRNSTRDLANLFSSGKLSEKVALERINETKEQHLAIRELLYDERAILPPLLFQLIHDLHNKVTAMELEVRNYFSARKSKSKANNKVEKFQMKVSELFSQIDEIYSALVLASQSQMNVIRKQTVDTARKGL